MRKEVEKILKKLKIRGKVMKENIGESRKKMEKIKIGREKIVNGKWNELGKINMKREWKGKKKGNNV